MICGCYGKMVRKGASAVIMYSLFEEAITAEEETMTVIIPQTGQVRGGLSFDDAAEFLEDNVDPPSYRGNWYYLFDNGCVTYTFDAQGPGVETIESNVEAALGLFDAEVLRQSARDAGFDIP